MAVGTRRRVNPQTAAFRASFAQAAAAAAEADLVGLRTGQNRRLLLQRHFKAH